MTENRIKPPLQLARVPGLLTLRYYELYGRHSISCELQTKPGVTVSFSLDDWQRLIQNFEKQKQLQKGKNRIFAGLGVKFLKTVPKPTQNSGSKNAFYEALGISPQTRSALAKKIILVFHDTTLSLSRKQYLRLRDCFLSASRRLVSVRQ